MGERSGLGRSGDGLERQAGPVFSRSGAVQIKLNITLRETIVGYHFVNGCALDLSMLSIAVTLLSTT